MSLGIHLIGFVILVIGLTWGAYLAHVSPKWIGVGVFACLGPASCGASSQLAARTPDLR
jgi:hypothetical protein